MASFLQDLAYAARVLRKSPGFTAIALLTLAIGIGANTAVFSVFHAVLLRPLPYPNAQDIVAIWEKRPREADSMRVTVSAADFVDWRRTARSFSSMALYTTGRFSLTGKKMTPPTDPWRNILHRSWGARCSAPCGLS